jgi:hypothetical protein
MSWSPISLAGPEELGVYGQAASTVAASHSQKLLLDLISEVQQFPTPPLHIGVEAQVFQCAYDQSSVLLSTPLPSVYKSILRYMHLHALVHGCIILVRLAAHRC